MLVFRLILSTASGIDLTGSQQRPPPTGDVNRKNKLRQQKQKQQQQQPNDLDRARRSAHRYNETPQPYYHHLEAQQRYDSMKQEEKASQRASAALIASYRTQPKCGLDT